MKKIFTLIAAALMAVGAQAQKTWNFSDTEVWGANGTLSADLTVDGLTIHAGEGTDSNGNANETFVIDDNNKTVDGVKYTRRLKSGGSTNANGKRSISFDVTPNTKITIVAASSSGTASRTMFIATEPGSDSDAATVVTKFNDVLAVKSYSYTYTGAATTLYICQSGGGTNYYAIMTTEDTGEGGDEPTPGQETEGEVIASYIAGATTGSWEALGNADLNYEAKYNKNSTKVKAITFPSSATKTTGEGESAVTEWACAAKVTGDFKKGDVITIQPFTVMSEKDFNEGSKYANIILLDSEKKTINNLTGSAAGALTVTDGHEEAGEPKKFTYTLENDYSELFFGRGGGTRINVMLLTITRGGTSGISDVTAVKAQNNVVYNLAGQRVSNGFKGIVIKNGKKIVIK